jgi:flagellar protein FlaG
VNISSVDMAGTMTGSSVTVKALGKTADSTQAAHSSGGNTDVSPAQVKKMVEEMQSYLDSMNISLRYFFYGAHDEKIAVKVVNKETGAVIREIPPKEMQALQVKMEELCGMIFNGKA